MPLKTEKMLEQRSDPEVNVDKSNSKIGVPLKHESATAHVCGKAVYVDDHPEPKQTLHAYVGLSSIAKGHITKIDLSQVEKAEGVVSVLTLSDVPGICDIGPVYPGDPIMVNEGDVVEFYGQVIFAVAAKSYVLARRAARLAKITYEIHEPDHALEKSLKKKQFVRPVHEQTRGNVAIALKNSTRMLSGELDIGGQEQMYLEGQVSLCVPTECGGMIVHTSSQSPTEGQRLVAEVLNVPMNLVTVDVRRMGGGFGGKETNANQWACIAALLARKTNRPVKLRLARVDDFIVTGKRHPFKSRYKVGFDDNGLLTAIEIELAASCGMSADLSDAIVDRAMFHADNAYFLPHAKIVGHRVKTNTVSNTAFRGFGGPQGMVAIEHIIDDIARNVGKDPLSVRKINFYNKEKKRDITHYGQKIEQHIIPALVNRLETTSDYWKRKAEIKIFNSKSELFKKGLALTPVKFGISFTVKHMNQAGALVHIYTDGSIHLNHGGTEMGQGLFTKVAQIVAHVFDVDTGVISCSATRTDKVPNTSPTAASSSTDLNGMAAKNAAEKIKDRLVMFAMAHFSVCKNEIQFLNGRVLIGENRYAFKDFIMLAHINRISLSATGFYRTPKIHYDRKTGKGRPFYYYANGAAVSEVIIDTLTGEYKVTRVDICHDVGTSINPALDIGQIEGAFIQGMGWLTSEELIWDCKGKLTTNNTASYKIPAISDTPISFNVELLPKSPNMEATIFHSKAVGEPPLMLAISTWSALRDAISSISDYRISPRLDTPATPERVFTAYELVRKHICGTD